MPTQNFYGGKKSATKTPDIKEKPRRTNRDPRATNRDDDDEDLEVVGVVTGEGVY
jgi:hypothetical protein